MPYLDIEFEGMALFVSSGKEKRSEALFIDTNKVEVTKGMNVTITTTAGNDERAMFLLAELGMPFVGR